VSTAARSGAELIAAYLDAVIGKDAAAVDCFFDADVEYMVNGTLDRVVQQNQLNLSQPN